MREGIGMNKLEKERKYVKLSNKQGEGKGGINEERERSG